MRKEVHYFDSGKHPGVDNYARGNLWYRSHFPLRCAMSSDDIVGEASPFYLFTPLAPPRIAQSLPDAKLFVLLRNPVARAISHYYHEVKRGWESLPMHDAMLAEESRLEPSLAVQDFKSHEFIRFAYKRRGLYCEQLKRYLDHFPRDRIMIICSETFFSETRATVRDAFSFLGLEPKVELGELAPRNVSTNRTRVPNVVTHHLQEYFAEPNKELYELLGSTYDW